jgi:hemophore-related protein
MQMTATTLRRGLYGMLAGGMLTAGIVAMVPTAQSAPDPCSSANQALILSNVSQNISNYLAKHPDVNQSLTAISKQPPAEANNNFEGYFHNDNPGAANDLRNIQAPLVANQQQCGRQVNPTDTFGAFQRI